MSTTTLTTDALLEIVQTTSDQPRVTWHSSTIDNEGKSLRKYKACCIFHRRTKWCDTSDDEDDEGRFNQYKC